MATIVLIGCGAQKACAPAPARDLYQGPLFKKSLAWAERRRPDAIYVLSAKHGLVPLNRKLACYDESLNGKPAAERKAWAARVLAALKKAADPAKDTFIVLAGARYSQYLRPFLPNAAYPLDGKRIGERQQWLKAQ
jgi:hypothetical protein